MSDTAKLREALEASRREWGVNYENSHVIILAARELLVIKESGSIVITRDAEGNWPESTIKAIGEAWWTLHVTSNRQLAAQILDALADSSKAPEQVGEPR